MGNKHHESQEYYIFVVEKSVFVCLTSINNKVINNFFKSSFSIEKKKDFRSDPYQDPDPLFYKTVPRIRIQLKMKRISNTSFESDGL